MNWELHNEVLEPDDNRFFLEENYADFSLQDAEKVRESLWADENREKHDASDRPDKSPFFEEVKAAYLEEHELLPENFQPTNPFAGEIRQTVNEMFTPEQITDWPNKTDWEKADLLYQLVDKLSALLGVEVITVITPLEVLGGFDRKTSELYIGTADLYDDRAIGELIATVVHEMEHAFQHKAIEAPASCGISQEQAAIWKKNAEEYIPYSKSPEGYRNQPIEKDAEQLAEWVTQSLFIKGEVEG